jgi:hypothetical protein
VAADLGKLSLALRRTGSAETAATQPVRTSAFVGANAHAPVAVRRVSAPRVSYGILIIEGDRKVGGHAPAAPPPPVAPAPAQPAQPAAANG